MSNIRSFQVGVTLVELMVGLLLGSLLLLGVIQVFDSSRQGAQVQRAMASVQDSGRIAMEFLSRDIRNADFSGCLANKDNLNYGLLNSTPNYRADVHSYYNLGAISGQTADSSTSIGGSTVVEDSDILQLVGARPFCDGVINVASDQVNPNSSLTLVEDCPIPNGTVLLVANCFRGDIFVKTGGTGAIIEHSTAVVEGLANDDTAFSNRYLAYDSYVYKPFVYTYFIAPGANQNNALFRREDTTNFEIVPNVEDFQIVFGVDTNDDNFAETFIDQSDGSSVGDPSQIMSVRASITVRSPESISGTPITRTYTTTVNIRNRTAESSVVAQN